MSISYVSSNKTQIYRCEKQLRININEEKIELKPEEIEKKNIFWKKSLSKNSKLFNGKVLSVDNIKYEENSIFLELNYTDYAHLNYIMNYGVSEITPCRSVAAGALLITRDEFAIVGKMGQDTSFPGIIQCIGGGISEKDFENNISEVTLKTVIRECEEEIGIVLDKYVKEDLKKYVYIREKMSTFGVVYVINLELNRKQLFEKYLNSKDKIDNEIEKLIPVKCDEISIRKFCDENFLVDYLEAVLCDYIGICDLAYLEKESVIDD